MDCQVYPAARSDHHPADTAFATTRLIYVSHGQPCFVWPAVRDKTTLLRTAQSGIRVARSNKICCLIFVKMDSCRNMLQCTFSQQLLVRHVRNHQVRDLQTSMKLCKAFSLLPPAVLNHSLTSEYRGLDTTPAL